MDVQVEMYQGGVPGQAWGPLFTQASLDHLMGMPGRLLQLGPIRECADLPVEIAQAFVDVFNYGGRVMGELRGQFSTSWAWAIHPEASTGSPWFYLVLLV